jgi:hypothetical protein
MFRTLGFLVTAVVFALIGSQLSQLSAVKVPHQGQKCADDNCKVIVKVDSGLLSSDTYVDYELTEAQGHHISFELADAAAPRYEFPANGIVFTSGFNCQKTGKTFKCTNLNPSQYGVYKYAVNVFDTRYSKNLDPLDPWVVNN